MILFMVKLVMIRFEAMTAMIRFMAERAQMIYGGEGHDTLDGGIDDDIIYGNLGDDTITGGSGNDELYGHEEDDTIHGGLGNDTIDGGEGDDTVTGGEGDDKIYAKGGNDSVTAGSGNDTVTGGEGDDTIDGGEGDDTITAGLGADTITGGAGRDTFIFTYDDFLDEFVDVIKDFEVGTLGDILDVSDLHTRSIEANSGNTLGQEIYPYSLGYIRFISSGDDTVVAYDIDGHGTDNLPQAFAILKGVDTLDLTVENLSEEGMNFGISNGGIVSETIREGNLIHADLKLWGGQPSDTVQVEITLPNTQQIKKDITINPEEWNTIQRVTFNINENFSEDDINKLSAKLTSNDSNFNDKNLQYQTTQAGTKSSFITQKQENPSEQEQYFAYEVSENLDINKSLHSLLPHDIDVISSRNALVSASGPSLSKINNNIVLNVDGTMAVGSYNYDLTYMDSTFNLFSEQVKVDLVKKNESPIINTDNAEIVINSKPFSNVEIKDDVGIGNIDILLKSGFSNNLSLILDQNSEDDISITWDDDTDTISLFGDGSVDEFNQAIKAISVIDNEASSGRKKEIEIIVTDKQKMKIS